VRNQTFLLKLLVILFLILATYTVFYRVLGQGFVGLDDNVYVTENPYVREGLSVKGLIWAFKTMHFGHWIPLTWLSLMSDAQLYGLNAGGYHLTNLLIHILNVLLIFLVLERITGAFWQSAMVAALFALHPLRVESVAWISERKGLLSTLFFLLTIWIYAGYAKRPHLKRYFLVALFFLLCLMSKPMLVTLPLVLLLLDFWPFERFRIKEGFNPVCYRLPGVLQKRIDRSPAIWPVLEKIPLLVIAVIFCILTVWGHQYEGAVLSFYAVPLMGRIANAAIFYTRYIGKLIWPCHLAVYYPNPGVFLPWQFMGALLILLSISGLVIWKAHRRYLVTGWLWYLTILLPVIGLIQAGQAGMMADRFTYVPLIGLLIIMVWGIPDMISGWRYRKILLVVLMLLLPAVLMIFSRFQVGLWQDSITLFEHTLKVTDDNWLIHYNLGNALILKGNTEEGISHYKEALRIRPDYAQAYYNLALVSVREERIDEGIANYREALLVDPDFEMAHNNLGIVLARRGKTEEAVFHYSEALRIRPDDANTHFNLGMLRSKQGRFIEAIKEYNEALRKRRFFPKARFHLGLAYLEIGRRRGAIDEYHHLKTMDRDLADMLFNRIY